MVVQWSYVEQTIVLGMLNDGFVVRRVSASGELKEVSVWIAEERYHYIFRLPILSFFQRDRYQGRALGLLQDRKSIVVPAGAF